VTAKYANYLSYKQANNSDILTEKTMRQIFQWILYNALMKLSSTSEFLSSKVYLFYAGALNK